MATSAQLLVVLNKAQDNVNSFKNDVKMYHDSYVENDNKINSCTLVPANMYGSPASYTCTFDNQSHTTAEYQNWVSNRTNAKLGENSSNAKLADAQTKADIAQKAYNDQVALELKTPNKSSNNSTTTKTPTNSTTKAIIWAVVVAGLVLTGFIVWYKRRNK